MTLLDAAIYATHLVFAGLWSGTVLFTSYAVLPAALAGDLRAGALGTLTGKLRTISRASAVILLLSGGHLAATLYTTTTLFGSGRGHLVLTMVALWFTLAALVEIGASKLADGVAQQKVRQPAHEARPFLLGASLTAVLLLVDAGAILGLYY
jgi:hypothetical protein